MCARNFGRDIEAETQALLTRAEPPRARMAETAVPSRRQVSAPPCCKRPDRSGRWSSPSRAPARFGPVRQSIAEKIRKQLADTAAVGDDGWRQANSASMAARDGPLELLDDLFENGLQGVAERVSVKPPPRRPRAKSSTLLISAAMRATLLSIMATTERAFSSSGRFRRSAFPPRLKPADCAGRGQGRR